MQIIALRFALFCKFYWLLLPNLSVCKGHKTLSPRNFKYSTKLVEIFGIGKFSLKLVENFI